MTPPAPLCAFPQFKSFSCSRLVRYPGQCNPHPGKPGQNRRFLLLPSHILPRACLSLSPSASLSLARGKGPARPGAGITASEEPSVVPRRSLARPPSPDAACASGRFSASWAAFLPCSGPAVGVYHVSTRGRAPRPLADSALVRTDAASPPGPPLPGACVPQHWSWRALVFTDHRSETCWMLGAGYKGRRPQAGLMSPGCANRPRLGPGNAGLLRYLPCLRGRDRRTVGDAGGGERGGQRAVWGKPPDGGLRSLGAAGGGWAAVRPARAAAWPPPAGCQEHHPRPHPGRL